MGDPLTPNLPEGWKNWAASKSTLLLGLGVIGALNLYVCCYFYCSKDYTAKAKRFWFLIVWIYPVVGGLFALSAISKHRKAKNRVGPASKGANDQSITASGNSGACNPPPS